MIFLKRLLQCPISPAELPVSLSSLYGPAHSSAKAFMVLPAALAGIVRNIVFDDAIRFSKVSSNVRHLAPLLVVSWESIWELVTWPLLVSSLLAEITPMSPLVLLVTSILLMNNFLSWTDHIAKKRIEITVVKRRK